MEKNGKKSAVGERRPGWRACIEITLKRRAALSVPKQPTFAVNYWSCRQIGHEATIHRSNMRLSLRWRLLCPHENNRLPASEATSTHSAQHADFAPTMLSKVLTRPPFVWSPDVHSFGAPRCEPNREAQTLERWFRRCLQATKNKTHPLRQLALCKRSRLPWLGGS